MGSKTGIEWTDSTWNPFIGCSRVSEGCRHCYAERMAGRFSNNPKAAGIYQGTTKAVNGFQVWTGKINQAPEGTLLKPLHWRPHAPCGQESRGRPARRPRMEGVPVSAIPKPLSPGEEAFALHCRAEGLEPVREYVFWPPRRWRFDFAFPAERIAIEIEGGIWRFGGHNRGGGYEKDCEKYNAAVKLRWRVLRYSTEMVLAGAAIDDVLKLLGKGPTP
jgi:very-short-patch-repair endonuclease